MTLHRQSAHVTSLFDQQLGMDTYQWEWKCMAVKVLYLFTLKVLYGSYASVSISNLRFVNEKHWICNIRETSPLWCLLRVSVWENQAKLKNLGRRGSADLNHISVGYFPYPNRNHDNIFFPLASLFLRTDHPPPKNCPSGVAKVEILSEIQLSISFEEKSLRALFT